MSDRRDNNRTNIMKSISKIKKWGGRRRGGVLKNTNVKNVVVSVVAFICVVLDLIICK